jgi:hypothetical protein
MASDYSPYDFLGPVGSIASKILPLARGSLGPVSMATMGDGRPDNTQADTDALTSAYGAARAARLTPNGRVADDFNKLPYAQGSDPMSAGATSTPPALLAGGQAPPLPPPIDVGSGGSRGPSPTASTDDWLGPHSVDGAQLPGAVSDGSFNALDRAAGDQPSTGFGDTMDNLKNAFAYRDPTDTPPNQANGQLPPSPTQPPQHANGPDLIQKFMTYLHNAQRRG